ncbi:hypothetical protein TD95_001438 [Thielaviopsis punctulata]|uniref:non-specific serine/threonine protein kinase n=1 Tax=Thielaviopsis punctulata TaxID=72032 RepID=A0A0F4ZAN8_9PEZI|nr:hypothetical protein TD95_001438 [Thielaviopsis punctulata]
MSEQQDLQALFLLQLQAAAQDREAFKNRIEALEKKAEADKQATEQVFKKEIEALKKKVEAAEKKVEAAEHDREALKKEIEAAKQAAKEKAEAAEKEIEATKQAAKQEAEAAEKDREALKKKAEAAKHEAEAAKHEAEAAKHEAEAAKHEAEAAKQEADHFKTRLQPTTLHEFITAYHENVSKNLSVEQDKNKTTAGRISAPSGKLCPNHLKYWSDFETVQRNTLSRLYDLFDKESRLFESLPSIHTTGNRVKFQPVNSEKTLEYIVHISVEEPVAEIIRALVDLNNPELQAEFKLGQGVKFDNHDYVGKYKRRAEALEARQAAAAAEAAASTDTATATTADDDAATTTANDTAAAVAGTDTATATTADDDVATDTNTTRPSTPEAQILPDREPSKRFRLLPDQICIFRESDIGEEHRAIYVCEYKPPHKLTIPDFERGLHPMQVHKDVVSREKISTDDKKAKKEKSEGFVASAITQTYNYMIGSGLEYGILTTGEAVVFLKIDWTDPGTLYYYYSVPQHSTVDASQSIDYQLASAIGQYLAFTLMSLQSETHSTDERQNAELLLDMWQTEFPRDVSSLPASTDSKYSLYVDNGPAIPSDNQPSTRVLRKRKRSGCRNLDDTIHKRNARDDDDDDDNDDDFAPDTPTQVRRYSKPGNGTQSGAGSSAGPGSGSGSGSESGSGSGTKSAAKSGAKSHAKSGAGAGSGSKSRSSPYPIIKYPLPPATQNGRYYEPQPVNYCTQKCLLGLVHDDVLDPNCPNVDLHRKRISDTSRPDHHPIAHSEFLVLLMHQLHVTLDRGFTCLNIYGDHGVLFKVSLLEYGYTFMGKGAPDLYVEYLKKEVAVYNRLKELQGIRIPVVLASLDMNYVERFYPFFGLPMEFFIFMSWGGVDFSKVDQRVCDSDRLQRMATRTLRKIHECGILHNDVRLSNMLYNEENDKVVMIDFERSQHFGVSPDIYFSTLRSTRQPISGADENKGEPQQKSNKRRRISGADEKGEETQQQQSNKRQRILGPDETREETPQQQSKKRRRLSELDEKGEETPQQQSNKRRRLSGTDEGSELQEKDQDKDKDKDEDKKDKKKDEDDENAQKEIARVKRLILYEYWYIKRTFAEGVGEMGATKSM